MSDGSSCEQFQTQTCPQSELPIVGWMFLHFTNVNDRLVEQSLLGPRVLHGTGAHSRFTSISKRVRCGANSQVGQRFYREACASYPQKGCLRDPAVGC